MKNRKNFTLWGKERVNNLKIDQIILFVTFCLVLYQALGANNASSSSHVVISKEDSLKLSELKRIVCRDGMTSILRREPNGDFVPDDLSLLLMKDNYDEIGLDGADGATAEIVGNENCRYIVKDRKGLRTFSVELFKNEKFPALYKIYGFDEIGSRKGAL